MKQAFLLAVFAAVMLARLSLFSATDRFLGGVFGLVRGAVMIGLLVMLCRRTWRTSKLRRNPKRSRGKLAHLFW